MLANGHLFPHPAEKYSFGAVSVSTNKFKLNIHFTLSSFIMKEITYILATECFTLFNSQSICLLFHAVKVAIIQFNRAHSLKLPAAF